MYQLCEIDCGGGTLGIGPMPGRAGDYAADIAAIAGWRPALVVTLVEAAELAHAGAGGIGADLARRGIAWCHLSIADYGVPEGAAARRWPVVSRMIGQVLAAGGRVFVHCMGGCGRSGMIALRLMIEAGEPAGAALVRLRAARPCAVETKAQSEWAAAAVPERALRRPAVKG
jgi:protein-tyrosine phosphatase